MPSPASWCFAPVELGVVAEARTWTVLSLAASVGCYVESPSRIPCRRLPAAVLECQNSSEREGAILSRSLRLIACGALSELRPRPRVTPFFLPFLLPILSPWHILRHRSPILGDSAEARGLFCLESHRVRTSRSVTKFCLGRRHERFGLVAKLQAGGPISR